MIKAYKYKILPSEEQKQPLNKFFGCTRYIYNWGLNLKTQAYKENGKSVSYNDLAKQLTVSKQQNETSFLCECANESLQQSLRNLENAFTGFFRKKSKYPNFKSKKKSRESAKFIRGLFRSGSGRLINADVNGSYNILIKCKPNAFGNGVKGVVVHPLVIKTIN